MPARETPRPTIRTILFKANAKVPTKKLRVEAARLENK
jgi:hypothetical protein